MTSAYASDILFNDFALLTQQFGRERLIVTALNADCDCASSPSPTTNRDHTGYAAPNADSDGVGYTLTPNHDDHYTDQIAGPVAEAN